MTATLHKLSEVVADMVRVQLLTGMRPGEMCKLRPGNIDRSGDVWFFRPLQHKTTHHGHSRTIAIGPRCQQKLLKYMVRAEDAYCFQPRDSESKRLAANEAARVTPISCGNRRGTNCNGTAKAGKVYSTESYRQCVKRAAARAQVEIRTPHQLRHSKASEIRTKFSLDHVQSVLGHKHVRASEIHAELDADKAAEVALKIG